MKKFISRLVIFALPIFVLLAFPIYVLRMSGEALVDIDEVIKERKNYLIGYMYNEKNYRYLKWKTVVSSSPKKVLALGSSRVLQFRSQMFESSFYNAGYTITGVNDLQIFMESVPKSQYPEYMIVGLDQWMFNENWDNLKTISAPNKWEESHTILPDIKTCFKVYTDLYNGKISLGKALKNSSDTIGLNSIINNTGFRRDGSIYYGSQIHKLLKNDSSAEDYQFTETLGRIKKGVNRFERCDRINNNAVKSLERFLAFCKTNRIKVIAILPPFADKVNAEMEKSGKYIYKAELNSRLQPFFKRYGHELYDYSALSNCSSNDFEAIDGFHGGELVYAKMLLNMLENGSELNNVCKKSKLKNDIENASSHFMVYKENGL